METIQGANTYAYRDRNGGKCLCHLREWRRLRRGRFSAEADGVRRCFVFKVLFSELS